VRPWPILTALSLERRIQIGFAIGVAIIVIVGAVALRSSSASLENAEWVTHTLNVRGALAQALASLVRAESGVRGFEISGDSTLLREYETARQSLSDVMTQLRMLTTDNPAQQRRIDSLDVLIPRRIDLLARVLEARRTRGLAAAAEVMRTDRAAELMDQIRTMVARMEDEETRLLGVRSAALRARTNETRVAVLGGTTLAFVIALIAGVLVRRELAGRQLAEVALRESEERLRLLVESVRDYAIYMLDPAGRVATWNRGAQQIKGYTREEIIGQHFSRFYPPEAVAAGAPANALRVAAAAGRFEEETWRVRKDGSRFWADVVITPVRDPRGQVIGFAKVTRDLTERQRAEEALRASEERFRILAVTANDAIISADGRGYITYFNPAAERIFGYTPVDVIGQPLTVLMPERFRDAHRAGVARYLATGEARVVGRTVELVGRRQDGTEFPVELSLASWKRGGEIAFTAIIRDVTERKRIDELLRRHTAQLEITNAELDAFAYSVSHDLRAPLRSIDGFSQALLEDYAGKLDQAGRDYLQRVRAASQRMATLIDDLLNLSRVTRSEMVIGHVDLSELARELSAEFAAGEPGRKVDVVIAPGLEARGDQGLLRVALQNLMGNAWKFTGKRTDARIEVGMVAANGERAYFVRDNGAGFDMTYAPKLFGAFQRLHRATEFPGTGVGLATVQRIIHRHGGRVWAESAVDRGATFYFTLS
jgi:PAS domain S-box-containing protein